MNELQDMKASGQKDKIIDILKKLKTQDEGEKSLDDVTEITNRLDGIDLDDADALWEKLTPDEQTMFRNYVEKGKLDFLPMWTPWWSIEKR